MGCARPLGKNKGGYHGQTIDILAVLRDFSSAAIERGWELQVIRVDPKVQLLAARRGRAEAPSGGVGPGSATAGVGQASAALPEHRPRVYISAGIHGDEPAGPLALLNLVKEDLWPANLDLWLCPCLNPGGFLLNRRHNPQGADLNRQYLEPRAEETAAHIRWLRGQPNFHLCLCLHEDWEAAGFYLYELNPDNRPSLSPEMIRAASSVCPVDHAEVIEGWPAHAGIIRPGLDPRTRPQWPEAFYLLNHHTRLSYTLEAPSDFPLGDRVSALVAAVQKALEMASREREKTD